MGEQRPVRADGAQRLAVEGAETKTSAKAELERKVASLEAALAVAVNAAECELRRIATEREITEKGLQAQVNALKEEVVMVKHESEEQLAAQQQEIYRIALENLEQDAAIQERQLQRSPEEHK